MFSPTIVSLGNVYSLQYIRRNPRGFLEAHYYCPNAWSSEWITVQGNFVSPSL